MLIDDPAVYDYIFQPTKIEEGVYAFGCCPSSAFLEEGFDQYPILNINNYGVCDSLDQIKAQYPELQDPARQFIIVLTGIWREDQPEVDGWRWCKWGPYIGDYKPKDEYLYNEDIEGVIIYHIYEKIKGNNQ